MKIAAFTMVYNEPTFLPLWRKHYGHAFGEENLFVLDHGSNDGSTERLGEIHKLRVPRSRTYDIDQQAIFIRRCQSVLLSYYDVVVFTDVDEFLVPDPEKFASLTDFIGRRCDPFVNAVGLDLYHLPDTEEDIDLSRPILSQRNYVRFTAAYCKPLITRIPLAWIPGFHACNYRPRIDADLFLFHLKRMDLQLACNRLKLTRGLVWSKNAHRKGHGESHRLQDQNFLERMFPYTGSNIGPHLMQGFDFSNDLTQSHEERPNYQNDYQGAVASIPSRFTDRIEGASTEPNMDFMADENSIRSIGTEAGRALKRLIAVNTIRDYLRPMADVGAWIYRR